MSMPEKQHQLPYEYEYVNIQGTQPVDYLSEVPAMQVPQSKLKKISRLEKLVFTVLIAALVSLAVATVRMSTYVNREEEAITSLETQKEIVGQSVEQLEQEKNELLRSEHLKKIAEKSELTLHEDNIRTIK